MALISALTISDMKELLDGIGEKLTDCSSLEAAAQTYVSILYDNLADSIVLARFFATIPFRDLPGANKSFVQNLARSAGISDKLKDTSLVLTLLGTRGVKSDWNHRGNSKDHVGIPLVSANFIEAIPMMSRLLKELGAGLAWIEDDDTDLVLRTVGNLSGVFYVRDAKTEVDNKGRKIIAAQEFVDEEKIKTVFGIGGSYLGSPMFFATIVFARETLEKDTVDRFMLHANKFKTVTMKMLNEAMIFA